MNRLAIFLVIRVKNQVEDFLDEAKRVQVASAKVIGGTRGGLFFSVYFGGELPCRLEIGKDDIAICCVKELVKLV